MHHYNHQKETKTKYWTTRSDEPFFVEMRGLHVACVAQALWTGATNDPIKRITVLGSVVTRPTVSDSFDYEPLSRGDYKTAFEEIRRIRNEPPSERSQIFFCR